MSLAIRFGVVDINGFRFVIPEGSSYTEYDHGEQGKQIHVFFVVDEREYRFTIDVKKLSITAEEIVRDLFVINSPLSKPEWCVAPHRLGNSLIPGWACAYGLMEGEGLRIHKAVFEKGMQRVTLTYASSAASYEKGFEIFDKSMRSFTFMQD